jgi:hypothetical protein
MGSQLADATEDLLLGGILDQRPIVSPVAERRRPVAGIASLTFAGPVDAQSEPDH